MKEVSKIWSWLPWILVVPAYFANLGLMPLWADEPTRALVALEMYFNQEFLVPTINSAYYLNKPPLYNWILLASYELFGWTEWATRLPAMLSIMGMSVLMYWGFKPEVGKKQALAAAFLYLTFGRMVYYSSHLGHIDPFYSDLIFFNFIFIYRSFRDQKWLQLFLGSYFLISIAFLTKGLPTLAFQALTLLALFISGKQFKQLLSWRHFAGIGLFAALVGFYYYLYFDATVSPQEYWDNLMNENVSRTAADKPLWLTIKHLAIFPLDQLYLFTPWFTLVPFLFQKRLWRDLWRQPFLRYSLIVVAVNLPIYWLSPDVRPRYLFMLYPFIFLWLVRGYFQFAERMKWVTSAVHILWIGLTLILGIGSWYAVTLEPLQEVTFLYLKVGGLSAGWVLLAAAAIRSQERNRIADRFFIMVSVLLIFKLAVQWIVLPYRYEVDRDAGYREYAQTIGKMTKGHDLYLVPGNPFNHSMSFYADLQRKAAIQTLREDNMETALQDDRAFFIVTEDNATAWPDYEVVYSFRVPYRDWPTVLLRKSEPKP